MTELTQLERESSDLLLLKEVANRLNAMLKTDPSTIQSMFSQFWFCSEKLSETNAFCFNTGVGLSTNVMGVLTGLIPLQTDTYMITPEILNRKIVGFKVLNCKQQSSN